MGIFGHFALADGTSFLMFFFFVFKDKKYNLSNQ